ncbi:response regulator [Solilutibacter silvestris]|uniref:Response regulator consisting of a CheY-like receiver domain and a winged-helix DNA-binding domain n=1 Tax=Solilutibacter silvestris TaxID=1645665 RepID=A0A2K1Q2G2_9GAMM|nr:response regulator [Lysobacter silvestris]PNS09147.1 Response regulator consisting of a CheY-like receiver domain and a winged-helix DNA-binding domain [Lysobacter silvestris]
MAAHILIAEDEADLAGIIRDYAIAAGWSAEIVGDGVAAVERARRGGVDVLVLDLMLPGLDGLSVCKSVRESCALPIIMVTARVEEIDRLLGLEAGADDYVCKPFSPRELIARIKAVLRRVQPTLAATARALEIDEVAHVACVRGKPMSLTRGEFALLAAMARRPGVIHSRALLLDCLSRDRLDVSDRAIDTHIKNLRRKVQQVAPELELIRSVYGVGYCVET